MSTLDFQNSFCSIICPYVNLSTEKDEKVIARNKLYAKLLYGVCCSVFRKQPIMPLLEYMDLPSPYLNPELVSEHASLVSCGYYEGKTPYWRDYSEAFNRSDFVLVGVDLGLSDGMRKVIENMKAPIVYVTIGDIFSIFSNPPEFPVQTSLTEKEGVLNLIVQIQKKEV